MMNNEIYNIVKSHKACGWGLMRIEEARNVKELVQILKTPKGVEFAMDEDFLSLSILEKYRKELEAENIFFDGSHSIVNPRFLLVLGGQVEVEINGFEVSSIYAKKGVLKLTAVENSFVTIEVKECLVIKEEIGNAKIREYIK